MNEILRGIYNTAIRQSDVEKIAKERMNECEKCPHLKKSSFGPRCGKCGCLLKLKTRSIKSECPEKRWLAIQE